MYQMRPPDDPFAWLRFEGAVVNLHHDTGPLISLGRIWLEQQGSSRHRLTLVRDFPGEIVTPRPFTTCANQKNKGNKPGFACGVHGDSL